MRKYELTVIFHPKLSEAELGSESAKVKELITRFQGVIGGVDNKLGKRDLGTKASKGNVTHGHFVIFNFQHGASNNIVDDVQKQLILSDKVIRFMTTVISDRRRKVKTSRSAGGYEFQFGSSQSY